MRPCAAKRFAGRSPWNSPSGSATGAPAAETASWPTGAPAARTPALRAEAFLAPVKATLKERVEARPPAGLNVTFRTCAPAFACLGSLRRKATVPAPVMRLLARAMTRPPRTRANVASPAPSAVSASGRPRLAFVRLSLRGATTSSAPAAAVCVFAAPPACCTTSVCAAVVVRSALVPPPVSWRRPSVVPPPAVVPARSR